MNLRSLLIVASLGANLYLAFSFYQATLRANESRLIVNQQEAEVRRLREVASKINPGASGLRSGPLGAELILLQKVKTAVSAELAKNRERELRCGKGSAGELGILMNQMADAKKKLDLLVAGNQKDNQEREAMVAKVEEEARKMKEELLVLCSR